MALAAAWRLHPCELRADLQQHYGIDIDHAMSGERSAEHIAALFSCLPTDARVFVAENPDCAWTREHILLAGIYNSLNALAYGLSNPKKRGKKPQPIGPSWMCKSSTRRLDARVLPIGELMAQLQKPRIARR